MREIDDTAYLNLQSSSLYRNRYLAWKARMLPEIDNIILDFEKNGVDTTMSERNLTPRDIALLVRLKYFTEDEVEKFALQTIEQSVPT